MRPLRTLGIPQQAQSLFKTLLQGMCCGSQRQPHQGTRVHGVHALHRFSQPRRECTATHQPKHDGTAPGVAAGQAQVEVVHPQARLQPQQCVGAGAGQVCDVPVQCCQGRRLQLRNQVQAHCHAALAWWHLGQQGAGVLQRRCIGCGCCCAMQFQ